MAVLETQETYAQNPAVHYDGFEQGRPALEGRAAFWHKFDDERRFEIGAGFHVSTTHVLYASVPVQSLLRRLAGGTVVEVAVDRNYVSR